MVMIDGKEICLDSLKPYDNGTISVIHEVLLPNERGSNYRQQLDHAGPIGGALESRVKELEAEMPRDEREGKCFCSLK